MSLRFKHCQLILAYSILLYLIPFISIAQKAIIENQQFDSGRIASQQKALQLYLQLDTISASDIWPNVQPGLFFANVRKNIEFPNQINQGNATNFCGYAAMTHLLVKYHPEIYLNHIIQLYRKGQTSLRKKTLAPSPSVRKTAGTFKYKGDMDILHADQLWFLALADEFKGYMNIFDHHYDPGDENKMWAGSNYGKFNRMLRDFTKDDLTTTGSDFIRPWKSDYYDYISGEIQKGVVLLFVNSKYLYAHKYSVFKLRAPTHFIVAYDMYKVGDQIAFRYWDYGLKTEQTITAKRLRKLIFGVTTITHTTNE